MGQGMRLGKFNIDEQCRGMYFILSPKDRLKARVGRGATVIVEG